MKAAIIEKLGSPLSLVQDVRIPELKPGQVLVDIAYSGVCHSQVMEARGKRGDDPWVPHMLGHEATGRVVKVGQGVSKVAPGDLVILGWIRGDGLECGGCQYHHGERVINSGGVTTFSEKAVVSENRVSLLPAGVPMDVGVLFGCALPTGAGIVLNEMQPKANTTLAVFGVGGIGSCALLAAKTHSFSKIIAIDVHPEKLELAMQLGATTTLDASDPSLKPVAEIRKLTDGGVDYAVDASGQTKVIEQAFMSTHPQHGLTLFASHPAEGEKISLDPHALICGRQIRGSWGGGFQPDRDIERFASFYREGRLPLDILVRDRYGLDQVNQALDDLEAGRAVRPILEINPNV